MYKLYIELSWWRQTNKITFTETTNWRKKIEWGYKDKGLKKTKRYTCILWNNRIIEKSTLYYYLFQSFESMSFIRRKKKNLEQTCFFPFSWYSPTICNIMTYTNELQSLFIYTSQLLFFSILISFHSEKEIKLSSKKSD